MRAPYFDEIDECKPRQGASAVGGKPPITSGVVGQRGKAWSLRKADQLVPCY